MDSNQVETMELKYLWLFKKVAARCLLLVLNVYEFAKQNSSGGFKTTVVSVQNVVVSIFGPLYQMLKVKDLPEQIIEFVDDKIDKYAPSFTKDLVTKSQSLIYKTKPFVKKLVTTGQAVATPLITATIFLLDITRYLIRSITPKPAPLSGDDQTAQNSGNTTRSLLGGIPSIGDVAQSLTTNPVDLANQIANTTDALTKGNPILDAVNSAAQNSLDAANTIVGDLPIVGDIAPSLPTNPADLANQIANTTDALTKGNPILDAVNTAAQNSLDAANTIVGDLPVVGDIAPSLPTNPADLANQILDTTNSLVNDNPLLGGMKPGATGSKAAIQAAYTTLKLAMIPVIAQLWYEFVNKYPTLDKLSEFILPLVEALCAVYNNAVEYMDEKGFSVAGYLPLVPIDEMKAAYQLVKTSRDGLSAVGDLLGIDNNKGLSAVGDLLGMNKNK